MLKQIVPGVFQSELTDALFDEISVEYDRDFEIRWLVDRQTGSVRLHILQQPKGAHLAA
jgi:hypothetical protein